MGTKINYTKRAAKILGLTLDETNELVKRLYGHYKRYGIDRDQIKNHFSSYNKYMREKSKSNCKPLPHS